jgi:4-hydroxymandelate oxidase
MAPLPINLHEYEEAARALLPSDVFQFIAGGSRDEVTLRACRDAFDRWRLLPRVLSGIGEASTATSVLGQDVTLPVLVAPVALHRLCHQDGERATARAVKAAGTIYTLSTVASMPLEEVVSEAGPWWFQLYLFRDRGLSRELVARAVSAGASAIVLTVDTPVIGRREADERNRFALPPGVGYAHLPAAGSTTDVPEGSVVAGTLNAAFDPTLTWADLDWLASLSPLPVVPKGILRPDDALRAVDHGARAVIVSNHGGRQLDGAVAALDALPAVVEAVADEIEVLVDGGIRRGTDVLKALALGARAVLLGRPIQWGLTAGGEDGVRHVLELLRAEIALDLMLCGLASPADVDRSLLVPACGRT